MNEENNIICRTCLSTEKELLSIYAEVEGNSRVIDYFNECMKITINDEDDLSKTICLTCLDNILEVRKFYLQCVNAENVLKQQNGNAITNSSVNEYLRPLKSEVIVKEEYNLTESEIFENEQKSSEEIFNDLHPLKNDELVEICFKCHECNEEFKYKKNYEFHMKIEHGKVENENLSKTIDHDIDGDMNKYDNCNKITLKKNIPRKSQKEPEKFRCYTCSCSFAFASNFLIHMKRHEVDKKIECKCPFNGCNREFYNAEALDRHVSKVHNGIVNKTIEEFLCAVCGLKLKNRNTYKRHLLNHNTPNSQLKLYKCRFCEKMFKKKINCKCHERKHTNERPYKCSICGKTFKQTGVLKTHMTLHTGKTIPCTVCDKKFSRKGFLEVHMRTHTHERPYVCKFCPQSFTQKCHLKTHLLTHTNERPYICNICGKAFNNREVLRNHHYIHLTIKRYKCPVCSFETNKGYWMRKHLKEAHSIEEDIKKYKRDLSKFLPSLPPSQITE